MRAQDHDAGTKTFGTAWIRHWLKQVDVFVEVNSLSPDDGWVLRFAIRWAPFGGASPAEVFVHFGVSHERFVQLVQESLEPKQRDPSNVRAPKRMLSDLLTQAW
ncbi:MULTISPECIES: hypothetical protein [Rhodococcus]|uniref:hypothetical protein n=1 Tax=Rhodococcus TaxID=1827 RepID=UPI000A5B1CF0|nr:MULTISPECIES: hypothetical protein [Rhodococcus]QHE73789.1 hypothetical protein GFS60_07455 [Rhodococcus sp. WAY2]